MPTAAQCVQYRVCQLGVWGVCGHACVVVQIYIIFGKGKFFSVDFVFLFDACGVCNGPGPTEVVIEDIVITYDSVFLPIDNEWFVYAVEVDTTFGYTCVIPIEGCMDSSACNYDELANTDDGTCSYVVTIGENCVVLGCTVPIA